MFSKEAYIAIDGGYFVSQTHKRIAEVLADYDPQLRLAFIPEGKRNKDDPNEKPYAVVDIGGNGRPAHIVMYSDVCDETLLARVFMNDTHKHNIFEQMKVEEDARELLKLKEKIEREEYIVDILKTSKRRSFS